MAGAFLIIGAESTPATATSLVHRVMSLAVAAFVFAVLASLIVFPGLWCARHIGINPSPLLRSLFEGGLDRAVIWRLVLMIPVGWAVALIGLIGDRLLLAAGFAQAPASSTQAALRQLFYSGSVLRLAVVALANAIIVASTFQLLLLSVTAWLVARISRASSRAAMWIAIVVLAPVFSVATMYGRQQGIRLVLDPHLIYEVIFAFLYWRIGFEGPVLALWSLVFTVVLASP